MNDLQRPLGLLASHLHRIRLRRAIGATCCVLGAGMLVLLAIDVLMPLHTLGLRIAGATLALVSVAVLVTLGWPRPISTQKLAHLLEEKYPHLAERLLTSLDPVHGSSALVEYLRVQTDAALMEVDPRSVVPDTSRSWLVAGALSVAVGVIPGWMMLGADLRDAWSQPIGQWSIHVTPGNGVAAMGRPLMIVASLKPQGRAMALPSECRLVLEKGSVAMKPDVSGHYRVVLDPIASDVAYRIAAGPVQSEPFRIQAVAPIEVIAKDSKLTIIPPPYHSPTTTIQPATESTALQYGQARFELAFSRTPATIDGPLSLDLDVVGKVQPKIRVTDEHGISSEVALPTIAVEADRPPAFRRPSFVGGKNPQLAPGARVPCDVMVADQVGLDRLVVEYRINEGDTQQATLFEFAGLTEFDEKLSWPMPSQLKEGDALAWRLKLSDTRNLPSRNLGPLVAYDPPEIADQARWHTVRISEKAGLLAKQIFEEKKHDLDAHIAALQKKIQAERAIVDKARIDAKAPALSISQARKQNQAIQDDLRKLGWKLAQDPATEILAEKAFGLANTELAESDRALSQALAPDIASGAREQQLQQADGQLLKAWKTLDALRKSGERLLADQSDRAQLEQLAQKEADLANQAEQPATAEDLAKLEAQQNQLARELDQMAEKSNFLKDSWQQAHLMAMQDTSDMAKKLAEAQREKNEKSQEALVADLKKLLVGLAEKQKALAARADALKDDTKAMAAADFAEASVAARALLEAQVEQALDAQEATIAKLEKLAVDLSRWLLLGRDPRAGAKQLATVQEKIGQDLVKLSEDIARLAPAEIVRKLQSIGKAQDDLGKLVQQLAISPQNQDGLKLRGYVLETMDTLKKSLQDDPVKALDQIKEAQQSLQELSAKLPGPSSKNDEKLARGHVEQSGALAKDQIALRDELLKLLQKLTGSGEGGSGSGPHKEQEMLAQETEKLLDGLLRLEQKAGPVGRASREEATQALDEAKTAMAKGQEKLKEGKLTESAKWAEQAALQLEIASRKAMQAAQEMQAAMPAKEANPGQQELARSVNQAQQQMQAAKKALAQRAPEKAQPAMTQAAQALRQAAKQAQENLARSPKSNADSRNPQSNSTGAAAMGIASSAELRRELAQFGARSWGDLPGELRTKLVQDLRARYGDDYAQLIQRYFERLAEQ